MIEETLDPDERRRYRHAALITGIPGAIAAAYAIMAYRHAPAVTDLYHLVYHDDRLTKPEGFALFLFSFPGMMLLVCIWQIVVATRGWVMRSNRFGIVSEGGRYTLIVFWTLFFFVGSLHRSSLVLDHGW